MTALGRTLVFAIAVNLSLAQFHPRIRALTGSLQAVAEVARTFGMPWQRSSTSSVVDHGTLFYLVARNQ
jgi:cytochrome oxidase Cu insertion factor (SCO1/SenC/PrrC family)